MEKTGHLSPNMCSLSEFGPAEVAIARPSVINAKLMIFSYIPPTLLKKGPLTESHMARRFAKKE